MKRCPSIYVLFATIAILAATPAFPSNLERRPFNVKDSVERTQFYPVKTNGAASIEKMLVSSPEKQRLFFVTAKGDVDKNFSIFRLNMVDWNDVARFADERTDNRPAVKVIAQFNYDQDNPLFGRYNTGGIKQLSFDKHGRFIWFIGTSVGQTGQVFRVNLSTFALEQVTKSPEDVADYAILPDGESVIYLIHHREVRGDCSKTDFIVGVRIKTDAICLPDGHSLTEARLGISPSGSGYDLYRTSMAENGEPKPLAKNLPTRSYHSRFFISPAGRYAVLVTDIPANMEAPKTPWPDTHWVFSLQKEAYDPNVMTPLDHRAIYTIVDLSSGQVHPLASWPIKSDDSLRSPRWISEDKLVLSNVFIADGLAHMKVPNNNIQSRSGNIVVNFESPGLDKLSINVQAGSTEIAAVDPDENKNENVEVVIEERHNSPPALIVKNKQTGRTRLLYDPNPQLKTLALGRVEPLNWTDNSGNQWRAGLVYPPSYTPGKRYPLVVQTHGFDPGKYLFDGTLTGTAPYAAQPLANRNIMVLQFPSAKVNEPSKEYPQLAEGIKSAVQLLDRQGKIDSNRVGLLGFSAMGMLVFNLIAFPDFPVAAAVIADAYSLSTAGYAGEFGSPPLGMAYFEMLTCGGQPWGAGLKQWIENNPAFHIDNITTPILLKEYNGGPSAWWDVYASLRRSRKPIEFRIYPDGKHPPLQVGIIYKSRQATVDWYDFWLNGAGPEIIGKDQHRRWSNFKLELKKTSKPITRDIVPLSQRRCKTSPQAEQKPSRP